MKHIVFIDPIDKLNQKKDSSLFLALALKHSGHKTYLLFKSDLFWSQPAQTLKLYGFEGEIKKDFYLQDIKLLNCENLKLDPGDTVHMRLDPPFDHFYLKSLWLLENYKNQGVKVLNSPRGIMNNHEKLKAFSVPGAVSSYVGEEADSFLAFIANLPSSVKEIVLKPLDLFSGIGVEKLLRSDPSLRSKFLDKTIQYHGAVVAQPFMESVYNGEIRALYFKGKHLGSILKKPKPGEFISNIAQGAQFETFGLSSVIENKASQIANVLLKEGVEWIAYDILGETITEINITCPGLLVEVSHAHKTNLALKIIEDLS